MKKYSEHPKFLTQEMKQVIVRVQCNFSGHANP